MSQTETLSIRRLRVINPLDWVRLLWWGLVTPDALKAYQKIYGKKAHKWVAGALISTILWSPIFIVMSATLMNNRLIQVDVILPLAPITMTIASAVMWLITWVLIATLDQGDETASYNPNNILPFAIGGLFSYITLMGMLGGITGLLVCLLSLILVGTCDTIGKHLKTNAESMIGVGIFTGMFVVIANALFNTRHGIAIFVKNADGFSFIGLAIFVISAVLGVICMALFTTWIEWFIKKTPIGGKVLFVMVLLSLAFLIWQYYLGGWHIFQPPVCCAIPH